LTIISKDSESSPSIGDRVSSQAENLHLIQSGTFNGLTGTGGLNGSIAYELSEGANGGLLFGANIIKRVKKKIDAQSPVPIGVS
jgi:hypothetical protein